MTSLFDEVKALNLPIGEFAIFGSGPLIVRGIIPASNDLDIICRGQAWKRVQVMGTAKYQREYDVLVVTLCHGRLSFGNKWGIGDFEIDALIDTAEDIDGLPFVRLEHVASYKEISRRNKDMEHLEALRAYRRADGMRRS